MQTSDRNPPTQTEANLTYRAAGVDIEAGDALVDAIKPLAKATTQPGVIGGLGGFGALFDLKAAGFQDPILVSTTDGVGTKLKLAIDTDNHDTIGIDLVAMCVNDLIVQGAKPLFFLDYFATGALDVTRAKRIIAGIAKGCAEAGCALVGGETAEMPGMYASGDYDLAGFSVGAVERGDTLPRDVAPGDAILGLGSSGIHSNGYSLVRRIMAARGRNWSDVLPEFGGRTLGDVLLAPTRIYVQSLLSLHREGLLKGAAHITGGGLVGNLPRVLPHGTRAELTPSWVVPPVFSFLAREGNVDAAEMLRVFNCGIGMAVIVSDPERAMQMLRQLGETVFLIGEVTQSDNPPDVVIPSAERLFSR